VYLQIADAQLALAVTPTVLQLAAGAEQELAFIAVHRPASKRSDVLKNIL